MNLEIIQPDGWAKPRGYANGILVSGPCRWLHVAGQIAWDAEARLVGGPPLATGDDAEEAPGGDFGVQFEQALRNVVAVVRAAGGEPEHLVSMTVYVTDKQAYLHALPAVGQAWRELVGRHYPAMALVQVADLLEEGAMVEIEARAAIPEVASGG